MSSDLAMKRQTLLESIEQCLSDSPTAHSLRLSGSREEWEMIRDALRAQIENERTIALLQSRLTQSEHFLSLRTRQLARSKEAWCLAAEASLAGKPQELHGRVAMHRAPDFEIVQSDAQTPSPEVSIATPFNLPDPVDMAASLIEIRRIVADGERPETERLSGIEERAFAALLVVVDKRPAPTEDDIAEIDAWVAEVSDFFTKRDK